MNKNINKKYMDIIHENEMTMTMRNFLEEIRMEQYIISNIGNKFLKLYNDILKIKDKDLEYEVFKIVEKYSEHLNIDVRKINSLEDLFFIINDVLNYEDMNINTINITDMEYRVKIYDYKKNRYNFDLYYIFEDKYVDRIKYSLNYSLSKDEEHCECVINTVEIFIGFLELENSKFTGSQLEIVSSSDINHYIIVSELESIQMDFKKMKDIYMHLYKDILKKMR